MIELFKVFKIFADEYKLECYFGKNYIQLHSAHATGWVTIVKRHTMYTYSVYIASKNFWENVGYFELADQMSFQKLESYIKQLGEENVKPLLKSE